MKYGISWYGDNASIAQTGYCFSKRKARKVAKAGAEAPDFWKWAVAQPFQVDGLTDDQDFPIVRADAETAHMGDEEFVAWRISEVTA